MSVTTFLAVFGFGVVAGIFALVVANKIVSENPVNILSWFRQLFLRLTGADQHRQGVADGTEVAIEPSVSAIDPREQNLYDSSQAIRKILLVLSSHVQRTDKAASASSLALGDVKSAVKSMMTPPLDLSAAHTQLVKEIDRVISSNTTLKEELDKAHIALMEQRYLIEELRTEVRIDGLTQLANRTAFDEKLTEMITVHKRYGDPFSLLMIDLDNFKVINDSYGHPAGDRLLKGVAQKIKATLRGTDFLARFGGDEYAVILVKTDYSTATEVAWKLCEEVRASRFLLDDAALTVTLSIGIAAATGSDTEESLLKRADKALYCVKAAGRNGVSVADPPQ